jgi:hypothetical protein
MSIESRYLGDLVVDCVADLVVDLVVDFAVDCLVDFAVDCLVDIDIIFTHPYIAHVPSAEYFIF